MPNIYVTQNGAKIKKSNDTILVEQGKDKLAQYPIKDVDLLIAFGNVQITTQAMFAMMDKGADIAFLTQNGHFKGKVISAKSKNVTLRIGQHRFVASEESCLNAAYEVIADKIQNGIDTLKRYRKSLGTDCAGQEISELKDYLNSLIECDNIDSLRGFEGISAKTYWEGFRQCLNGNINMPCRKYHPSPDPCNALLSFGYSFIAREMQGVLETLSLDPYIGFYHQIAYGRASLSLDLIEPYRTSFIDPLVLYLFNKGILGEDNFYKNENGGYYLQPESIKIFIKYYEQAADDKNWTYGKRMEKNFRKQMWDTGQWFQRLVNKEVQCEEVE